MKNIIIVFACSLFVIFLQPLFGDNINNKIVTMFSYKDKIYTCKDVTGISFDEGLSFAGKAKNIYKTKPDVFGENLGRVVEPSCGVWESKDKSDFKSYYIHSLNGTIVYFASYLLYKELRDKYPITNLNHYPYIKNIEKYINYHRIFQSQEKSEIYIKFDDYEEFIKEWKKEGRKNKNLPDKWLYRTLRTLYPYMYFSRNALPRNINNHPSTWYKWQLYSELSKYYYLEGLNEKIRKKLENDIFLEYQMMSYILVSNVTQENKHIILKLIKSLILMPNGELALRGLREANQVTRKLGMFINFRFNIESTLDVAKHFNIKVANLKKNILIPINSIDKKIKKSWIFIFRTEDKKIPKYFLDSKVYSLGKKQLLEPIAKKILSKIKTYPPFKKPTVSDLLAKVRVPTNLPSIQFSMEEDKKKK